jgi:putative PIN family toxin of toxin-antitoxin system
LDTKVLASGIAGEAVDASAPVHIFRYWRQQTYQLVLSDHILEELAHTLAKPYFRERLTLGQRDRAIAALRDHGRVIPITAPIPGKATHPEDDLVIATALSAHANFLVTGDRQLQALNRVHEVVIVSPREFLILLKQLDG